MNKKKLTIIISAIVIVVAVVAVIGGISINNHNEQKKEAHRQEEESKSKALAEELEQAKNELLAYISEDTYVEDKTTYEDEIQSAGNIDRINEIKTDYEAVSQEIKAEIERKAAEEAKAFEAAKTKAKSTISNTNYITADVAGDYKEKVDEAASQEEIDTILEEVAAVSNSNKTVRRPSGFSVGGSTTTGGSGTSQPVDEHEGLVYDEEKGYWVTPNHLGERGNNGTTIDWNKEGDFSINLKGNN